MIHIDGTSKRYLLVSDFDQTLSFHDSGQILSELLGVSDFRQRVAGLEEIHLVQQGGELAYLLLHDPDFRRVRKEHLIEVGKRVRLKSNIALLSRMLNAIDGHSFRFYVVSAAPEEVIQSALEGIVEPKRILGTRFRYDPDTERYSRSSGYRRGMGRWRWSMNFARRLASAMTGLCTWATADRTFT